jgi:hypothetical protein
MAARTDTTPPRTTEPAPGLRVQVASELFAALPPLGSLVVGRPLDGQHCLDFLAQLLAGPTPEEGLTFMAFALLARHGVWWGHECLKAMPDLLTDQDRRMMGLITDWVADQGDDSRYAAMDAGMRAESHGPGVWLALAAGWSGGSMSGRGLPPVAPPPGATGQALNAGIVSALARVPQDVRRRMIDHYATMAQVLAKSP